ncbi:tyrosine-type recombinase/integrase [Vibrio thalassae]
MSKDWRRFNEFCQRCCHPSLPASIATVKAFLTNERINRKYSTLKRYTVTISLVHYLFDFKDPVKSREVGLMLEAIRVAGIDNVSETQALTIEHLTLLQSQLASSQAPKDIRDLAIYCVMFECALKRRDLRQLMKTQITVNEAEDVVIIIDDIGYKLSNDSSKAIQRWLNIAPCSIVFTAIDRHGNISNSALNDSSIFRVLRRAGELLNLPFDLKFSSQSCRVGAVKKLARDGMHTKEIQEFGRWASPAMPLQYSGKRVLSDKEKAKFKDDNNYD